MSALLDRFYSALRRVSASELAECVSEDFILDWQGTDRIPWAGRWKGVQGLLDFVKALDQSLEIVEVQRVHFFEQEAVTVVVLKGHWRIKHSGTEVRATAANLFTFAGGKIQSYTVLNNSAAFLEALPMGPQREA